MDKNDDSVRQFHELSELAECGKFKEALEKHIWFHEASKHMPGMGGVRLSYALDLWKELAEKYQPAMEALVDLRNNNKEKLLTGRGNFDNFHDLSALNFVLDEKEDTLMVFLEIHKNDPEQAKAYYHVVDQLLVERKEYEICDHYLVDPLAKYSQLQHLHEMNTKLIKTNPEMDNDEFKEFAVDNYVKGVCRLIEVLDAVDKKDVAKEIQRRALQYFDNDDIRRAICF
jgi:hypothetical protein